MKQVASYHPLGARPHYYATDGCAHAPCIRDLLQKQAAPAWDLQGVRNYLQRAPDGRRTCFEDIRVLGPGEALWSSADAVMIRHEVAEERRAESLFAAFQNAVQRIVDDGRKAAVALSGGLDSALLIALLRKMGRDDLPVVTLATNLPGYCELDETRRTALALGVKDLRVIEIDAEAMIQALPDAIGAAEVPLFNLHPVSRWLLAQAMQREGFEVLITGDGADQIFAGSDARNYIPIVGALTRASGLDLRSPFFDAGLAASAPSPTSNKAALREIAVTLLPQEILARPNSARYASALDVSRHWNEPAINPLAEALGVTASQADSSADATLWTSLGILAQLMN